MHILSSVILGPAERETKVSGRTRHRTWDLWLLSQALSVIVYAKLIFAKCYSLRAENLTYRVPEFTVLTLYLWASEAQRRPGLLNLNPTGVGIHQGANGAPLRAEFNY